MAIPVIHTFSAENSEPQFRWGGSADSNMASGARNLPADPGATSPSWEVKIGTHQYSIPTLDRGRIYIAANDIAVERAGYKTTEGGALICVEQATGKLIWRMPSPRYFAGIKPPYHFDQWRCGICSGPLVDGDRVYVVGNRGEVLCLDREGQANGNDGPFKDELEYMGIAATAGAALEPTDGDIIWRYNFLTELGVIPHDVCGSTLLLHGDLLYACTSNGQDDKHKLVANPQAPTLIVLDKKTGRLVARDDEKIGERLFHCNWSSPVGGVVNGRPLIFFGAGDGILYAFDPATPTPSSSAPASTRSTPSTPTIQILKKVWSCDCNPLDYRMRDGKFIPPASNSIHKPDGPSEIIGVPAPYNGRLYVAIGQSPIYGVGQGCLSCVDAATGKIVWSSKLVERTLATAAISDGLLYIPDLTGNLHCFDAATGQRYWVHSLEDKTWCSSAFVADGKVYVGTEKTNLLWVLKAGKEKQVLSKIRLKAGAVTVTAADGVLYIPTQRTLIAIPGR
ncbi:MAG: PQQ-binding-like beta-propeller repeat protein [Candidatus Sumerlaeota bacterium]|nr:PQQ-binding-like beta-propeller repeat protein [Candidatus Sumerlaeota bacterium]